MNICVCCGREWIAPDAKTERGPIHFRCWDQNHSDPHDSCACDAEEIP